MKCNKCGRELPYGTSVCPVCYSGSNNNLQKNKMILIITVVVCVILILAMIFVSAYLRIVDKLSQASATPVPTPIPTETAMPQQIVPLVTAQPVTPAPTRVPTTAPAVSVGGYRTYRSYQYGFSCNYPAGFIVYDDGSDSLHTLKAPDGMGRQVIDAKPIGGATVSGELAAFLNKSNGVVTYKTSGKDYYAGSVRVGDTHYYKYCKFKNGNRYWFEMVYHDSQYSQYDKYINDIYASIEYY